MSTDTDTSAAVVADAETASTRPDLKGRADVHDLVVAFYRDIVFDDLLAPVFGEVAEVDWEAHIPKLIDYWCRVLFGEVSYTGSILGPHARVNDLEPFRQELFDRWYQLWTDALDRRWSGPVAERARTHAERISGVLSRRLAGEPWTPPHDGTDGADSTDGTTSTGAAGPRTPDPAELGGEAACWAHLVDDLDGVRSS